MAHRPILSFVRSSFICSALLGLALWAVSACSSSDDNNSGSPLTTVSEAEFNTAIAKAYCKSITHCCPNGSDDCVSKLELQIQDMLAQAKANNNVYDPTRAADCVNALNALGDRADCKTWYASTNPSLATCSAVLDGTIAPGDECGAVEECHHGLANGTVNGGFVGCAQLNETGPKRCRAFVPTDKVDAGCIDESRDAFAGPEGQVTICSNSLTCKAGQCERAPTLGEACPDGTCADGVCAAGTCQAFAKLGESCATLSCTQGSSCSEGTCKADPSAPWILSVGFWSTNYACPGTP